MKLHFWEIGDLSDFGYYKRSSKSSISYLRVIQLDLYFYRFLWFLYETIFIFCVTFSSIEFTKPYPVSADWSVWCPVWTVRTSQLCQRNKHSLISFFCRELKKDFEKAFVWIIYSFWCKSLFHDSFNICHKYESFSDFSHFEF